MYSHVDAFELPPVGVCPSVTGGLREVEEHTQDYEGEVDRRNEMALERARRCELKPIISIGNKALPCAPALADARILEHQDLFAVSLDADDVGPLVAPDLLEGRVDIDLGVPPIPAVSNCDVAILVHGELSQLKNTFRSRRIEVALEERFDGVGHGIPFES